MKLALVFSLLLAAATAADVVKPCTKATTGSCEHVTVRMPDGKGIFCCPLGTEGTRYVFQGDEVTGCSCFVGPPLKTYSLDLFRKNGLKRHDALRALHGASPLKVSKKLDVMALDYAKVLADRHQGLVHSANATSGHYGENIAILCTTRSVGIDYEGKEPVDAWYDEINDPGYDFNHPGFSEGTGHFTQVVWKATTMIGQGKARTEDGKCVYAVANYSPPGNMIGEQNFRENVAPPKTVKTPRQAGTFLKIN